MSVTSIPATTGDRIRVARERLGWSQAKLALECYQHGADLAGRDISRIEREDRALRVSELDAICRALHRTPNVLMGWE